MTVGKNKVSLVVGGVLVTCAVAAFAAVIVGDVVERRRYDEAYGRLNAELRTMQGRSTATFVSAMRRVEAEADRSGTVVEARKKACAARGMTSWGDDAKLPPTCVASDGTLREIPEPATGTP